jgi:diaminohydroxyphosphoribosylaminopyrimidine deaminase/5-amino-6-(5-phosphoribosylamino)uracil reductase
MPFPVPVAESHMQRAIELARRGIGMVEPNPAVGAVVVDDSGTIVGEGWHQRYGGPHAEVHALEAAGEAARGASLFVTLEPCCHFGKTPPCSRAVIAAGIRQVSIATTDPAPYVHGKGIDELRAAGIHVEVGLLQADARRLIAPFARLTVQGRPWFLAKWAMTLDGKIASRLGHSQWISNPESRAIVHQLRGRMDAILIGTGTAIADDPLLTARPAGPRTATRIVVDSLARLPLESRLVQTAHEAPVLLVTTLPTSDADCVALRNAGIEVLQIPPDSAGHPDLLLLAGELGRRRMTNVLVEGGSRLLGSFFDADLIDEVHAFVAPKLVGGASSPTPIAGVGLDHIPQLPSVEKPMAKFVGDDVYFSGHVARLP